MTNTRRVLIYIIPVTALSFALNIPKFMEVTISDNKSNSSDPPTSMEVSPIRYDANPNLKTL
jgi:hypothetical protein